MAESLRLTRPSVTVWRYCDYPFAEPVIFQGVWRGHGGTYNASTQMCTDKAQTLSAKQVGQDQGGYFAADQNCEFE